MADIPERTNPIRIALEDVTPVIAAVFADDACLIWSGEHRAYWVAGGNGYTTGTAYAGRWTIADAYRQTKHCDPTKQIAFERVDATRPAPPAMDREAVDDVVAALLVSLTESGVRSDTLEMLTGGDDRGTIPTGVLRKAVSHALSTLSADAIRQGEGLDHKVAAFVADYEFRGDDGDFMPNEWTKALIEDAIHGFLAQHLPATPASHASDGGKA